MTELAVIDGEQQLLTPDLTKEANRYFHLAETHAGNAVAYAVECGARLRQLKERFQHGDWEAWLASNFDGSIRKAQAYMQMAKAQSSADLPESINAGLKAIAAANATERQTKQTSQRAAEESMLGLAARTGTPAQAVTLPEDTPIVDPNVSRFMDALTSGLEDLHASLSLNTSSGREIRLKAAREVKAAIEQFIAHPS